MGGRPPVEGILAVAVAVLLASAVAAPPAAAEFSIPGLFSAKPKVVKPRRFRPTLPYRNPTRVTASLSADAVSPPVADNSEAAVVAGTSSSASVAMALPVPARKESELDSESTETADSDPSREDTSAESADASDEPAESAEADTPDEPAETAEADTPDETASDETAAEAIEPEQAEAQTDEAEAEPDATVETTQADTNEEIATDQSSAEAEPAEAEQGDAADDETSAEQTETASTESSDDDVASPDESPVVTASLDDPAPAELEMAVTEGAPGPEATAEPIETAAKAEALTHDATVVLEVSPPPEEVVVAAVVSDTDTAQVTEAANAAPSEETEETEVAALTPPDATATDSSDSADAETAEPAALDTAPSDDEKVDTEEQADGPEADEEQKNEKAEDEKVEDEKVEDEKVEDEKVEDEKVTSEDEGAKEETESAEESEPSSDDASASDETAETPSDDETVAEETTPPPPPAHPIVAEIRAKLEEPDQYKNVAASDLKALKEFYGTYEGPPLWVTEIGFTDKAKAIMAEIGKADDWGLDAGSFELPPEADLLATPNAHADDELQLSIAILSYARDAQIGRLSPSGVSKLFDQHPSLRDPKEVLTEMAASNAPDKYLLSLHPQHPQFKRLQSALIRARDSAKATGRDPESDRNVQLITINMERWRWMPRQLGNYHVWNNVPEYNVRVMKGGQAIYQEKTIVGQYKYATPFFTATMKNIVFHPNWTVPPTIIKEDLAPKLQGPGGGGFFGSSKEAVLARYGLSANYKGQRINADTVDWNNVNIHAYTFTQEPGPANVLGQFKFNFPNRHAIYMHDTPQRELFSQTTRTLSHGCIRVNQPAGLAALLLAEDKGWNMGHVQSLVAKGPQSPTVISLNHHIPVHLTYFTAVVDQHGTVNSHGDIYGIDNRMAAKLFKNPASFPVPATPEVAESSASSRAQAQSRRRSNGFDNFISGLFGN
jgi:L,D-transpeptidase YcbB